MRSLTKQLFNDLYNKALNMVMEYQSSQVDKCGYNYLIHLTTVSANCETEIGKIVGLLHDSIEDVNNQYIREEIAQTFGYDILDIILTLTKKENEIYDSYIKRVSMCPIATEVKIQDLKHNLDCFRLGANDFENENKQKYQLALFHLQEIW